MAQSFYTPFALTQLIDGILRVHFCTWFAGIVSRIYTAFALS